MCYIAKMASGMIYIDRNSIVYNHCKVNNKCLSDAAREIRTINDIWLHIEMLIVHEVNEKDKVTLLWIVGIL